MSAPSNTLNLLKARRNKSREGSLELDAETRKSSKMFSLRAWLIVLFILSVASLADAATKTWTGATSTNWATGTNWSGGNAPGAGDTVNIPGGLTNYPIISTTVSVTIININSAGSGATLTIASAGALTVFGLTTVNASGSFILSGGTASLGGLTSSGAVNVSAGTLTSTVNLALNTGAVLTQSGGTIHLAVNTSTGPTDSIVIASGARVNQSGGTLSTKDYPASGGTFNQTGATALFKVYHDWKPGTGSVFNSTAGTVEFAGGVGKSPDFANGTRQFCNLLVDSTADPLFDVTAAGSLSISGNFTNNNSALTPVATTSFTFNGSGSQTIYSALTGSNTIFGNLTISNTASTVTLSSNITVAGNLSVSSGTFDLATFTGNRISAGGILTVSNNATLKIGGTNTFPANYATNTLVVASTVEYYGTNQTVANQLYGNLKLSSSSGAATKTFPATALTVAGNLTTAVGAGTAVSFTAASNLTVNGNVSLGASTTFNGGGYSHNVGGNWSNSGIFNGNTSSVSFTGSGVVVSGSGTHNFYNLTVAGTGVIFSNDSFSVAGNLGTAGAGTFTQASGGTFLLTGSTKTISGNGISIDNLNVSGSISTATSLTLTGNLSVSGSLSASAGTIAMSGSSKAISGAGTKTFSQLYITGSVTTNADFAISSGLTINGSLSASAGTAIFTGTSTLSGTANLCNVTLNGTSLQLSTNSTMGVGNALTITAGTFNVTSSTPNTVNFNGAGAQNINGLTYNNLTLSNSNTKTAAAGVTVNGTLTIGAGTTFVSGAYTHSVYGDWNNKGTFTAGLGTVQFLGSLEANINGDTTFNTLTVNKATSATTLTLQSSVSASTINMTLGEILTGANTITITTTRTGSGEIYGNIQRTHSFTTGVAYAFETPNNTITFASVSGVNSITVSVVEGTIGDFPFGSSVNEQYTIAIPSGTYNATLRLDYDDDALNGNNESTLTLWNYNGSSWVNIGKTANDTTANYVEYGGLTNVTNRWTFANPSGANVVQWNGSTSTDWNTAANWTVLQGSPSRPPASADIVYLGTAAFTNNPTISNAVSVKQIHFGSAQAVTLTMANGGSLTSADVDGAWTSSVTHTINANNQNININGALSLSDGTSGHVINLNIGSGTISVAGELTQSGGANLVFSGAGNLNIESDYNYVSGTLTAGSGTVTYNGSSNQIVGAVTYNNLTINKAAGTASINGPVTVAGNLTVTAGDLENLSTTTISGDVTIASGAIVLNINGTLHIGGSWTNNGSYAANGSTIYFDGSGTQNISTGNFNNLIINKPVGSSAVLTGDLVINGDLTITSGTFNIKTFGCNRSVQGGTITIGDNATFIVSGNNAPTNFSNGSLSNTSTVIADGTIPQAIFGESFGNLIFRNGGVKTLVAPITVNGNLTIESGATFDAGSQTLTLNGNWINNGTFTPSSSTIVFSGAGKNISGNNTFNLMTISGSYTALSDLTSNSSVTITSTGALSAGSGITLTVNGDITTHGATNVNGTVALTGARVQTINAINSSTFILTLNLNGTVSPALNGTEAPTFGFLNINNTGGVFPDTGWTILLGLNVASGASFNGGASTHTFNGTVTNNGTITSSGTLNFAPSTSATVNMGSSFSSTGTVNFGGSGALTLTGSANTFQDVIISNTNAAGIAPPADWSIANDLTIAAGSILNAGSHTYLIGGDLENNGMLNGGTSTLVMNGSVTQDIHSHEPLYNLTINKSADVVTLSSDVTLNGALYFVAGQIQTAGYVLSQPASGTITGAGQSSGWVNGQLRKSTATGTASKTFEVGDATTYAPVLLAFSNVTTAGDLTASTTNTDHPNISTATINSSKSVNRYWTLVNSGIALTSYNATFNFAATDVDAGATPGSFIVGEYSNDSWMYPTYGTRSSSTTQATGLTTFGDFQLGATTSIPSVALVLSVSPNGTVAPQTDLVYAINFINSGAGSASAFVITDPIPANTDFKIGSATTSLGTTGLTPTISYSNDGGASWTYTPISGGGGAPAGYDRNVTHVRWSFGSSLSQTSPNNAGSVNVTARIR